MLKIFTVLLMTFLSADLYAGDYAEETKDVHKTRVFLNKTLVDKGYYGAQILGFDKGKKMALTTLYFSENDPEYIRTAEISEEADGASVYFRTYKKCHITNEVLNKIITVDEQRIQVAYMCAKAIGDASTHQEVYMAKTLQGKKFIQRAFLEKSYVHVKLELDDLEVPFSAKGFPDLWATVNRPSL